MYCSELALLHSELGLAIRILPFELWPQVLKQTAGKLNQSNYNPNPCVGLVDMVSSEDSLVESTQQQEQYAGSPRVNILYPKHMV
jgi:hypothetical protein